MPEGTESKALRNEENTQSDSLGAIIIRDSLTLSTFSEEAIQDAQSIRTPDVEGAHRGKDLFRGCFTRVEDDIDLSEASSLFDVAQRILSRALTLHRDAFSKCRAELSRCEADLQRLIEEKNSLKLLSGQKEEEIKDLRAELATAHKEQTELIKQHKAEKIEQLCEEVNMMRAETLGWKQNMDHLASEKDAARSQLSLTESQLQGMKEESLAQNMKIEELEVRLAAKLAKVKSEAENVKADAEAIVAIYQSDAEAAQAQARESVEDAQNRAFWITELVKCQSRRETLEEIHARGFDFSTEIKNAKELEAEAKALVSFDDDDSGSVSGSESRGDPDDEDDPDWSL
ncbi:WEB family protein At5g55860-like [Nicotiana sylvestris]|uniref:WEB family protein At5g55860-like n=1 Tax=Nicotiana sylvestris TaxID=4096 RepID=UPI00388C6C7B